MTRQRITPQFGAKIFESYTNFSCGLNSETSNELLRDYEFTTLDNVDLSGRGSVKRRGGRTLLQTASGTPQGMSYFYRQNQNTPDLLIMANGRLYISANGSGTLFEIPIENGYGVPFTYQSSKQIEAVQYYTTMYIATGTKLCELSYENTAWQASTAYTAGDQVYVNNKIYKCTVGGTSSTTSPTHTTGEATDGTVKWKYIATSLLGGWYAKVCEAYKPTQMEYIYIGTNALAENPISYVNIQDELGLALDVKGVTSETTSGYASVNVPVTFTCYSVYTSLIPLSGIEYKWEYKESDDTGTVWTLAKDYSGGGVNKSFAISFNTATKYDVRVTVRHSSAEATYILTNFEVTATPKVTLPYSGIPNCTKVLLHWDRLILYGDAKNPYQIYISDLNAPTYFPTTNTIPFDTGKQEEINTIVRYRDYLVLFTKTTVHSLTGKSPEDYERALIHDGIGCVAGRTAYVTGNDIMFLSAEGIYRLRPNQSVLETLNVFRADVQIKSRVYPDTDACGMVFDSQYWICFPSRGYMYRYYYEQGIWVRDISSQIKFVQMAHYGFNAMELSSDGKIYMQNNRVYEKTDLWTQLTVKSVGSRIINKLNNTVYECTVAGTTGTVPPTHASGTATDGSVTWKFVAMLHGDGNTLYDMVVQSKYLDLSMSFNYKKLKKIYILAKHFSTDVNLKVKVEADSSITLTPDSSYAEVVNDQVIWNVQTVPNFHFYSGTTVGTWALGQDPLGEIELSIQKASVSGKCRRVRVTFTHSDNSPCELYGFGLEFKEKKT